MIYFRPNIGPVFFVKKSMIKIIFIDNRTFINKRVMFVNEFGREKNRRYIKLTDVILERARIYAMPRKWRLKKTNQSIFSVWYSFKKFIIQLFVYLIRIFTRRPFQKTSVILLMVIIFW